MNIPSLPGKILFSNRFAVAMIEERRAGLERFLQVYGVFYFVEFVDIR